MGEVLKHILASQACVAAGSRSDNIDSAQTSQLERINPDLRRNGNLSIRQRNARHDGVAKPLGLVEDLLEHEVGETVFVRQDLPPDAI
jgi:hypothetical protein